MQALVTGASNQIGYFLLLLLAQQGVPTWACSRQPPTTALTGIEWQAIDLTRSVPQLPSQPTVLFHLAPLSLLPSLLEQLPQIPFQHVIAFSSTSRFTKQDSTDCREQQVAAGLAAAEQQMIVCCEQRQIPWTVLRPTLIYGCGRDKNVSFIARFIRRYHFFPVLSPARGLRQPVHAQDLAQACWQVTQQPLAQGKAYNLTGGETLTYHSMVTAIFTHLHKQPRLLNISPTLFTEVTRYANWLPGFRHVSPAMLVRMNQDLCFDASPACREFGYQARGFRDTELGV